MDDPVGGAVATLIGPTGMTFDAQGALLISSSKTSNSVQRYSGGVVVSLSAANPTPISARAGTPSAAQRATFSKTARMAASWK